MMKKMDRIKRMDESGVSEIVGSILTLAVTVIIFTGIFWGVQNLEPPERQAYMKFSTTVYMYEDASVAVNITNTGGGVMREYNTRVYIIVNHTEMYDVGFTDDSYGNELADGRWDMSETLNLEYDNSTQVGAAFGHPDAVVHVRIYDDELNQRVYNEEIKGVDELPPFIRELGVLYPHDYLNYALPRDTVTLYTDIVDKDTYNLDDITVTVDISPLEGHNGTFDMTRVTDKPLGINRYVLEDITIAQTQEDGNYLLPLAVSDNFRSEYNYSISINIGAGSGWDEESQLRIPRIEFDPVSPSNGQTLYVTATINNMGGTSTNADITFRDFGPDGDLSHTATPDNPVRFPAGGGVDITLNWIARRAGLHNITVTAEYNNRNVTAYKHLVVRPNILIVDNDQVGDGFSGDDASLMVRALDSAGFDAHRMTVRTGHRPRYDGGEYPMKDYDIVIWMTGAQTVNTMTDEDRAELTTFLDNNHRLWLIGEGIANEAQGNAYGAWLSARLRADVDVDDDAPVADVLEGRGDPIDGEEFHTQVPPEGRRGDYLQAVNEGNDVLIDTRDVGDEQPVAVTYNGTDTRTFFQSIRFASLEEDSTASRTRLAYNVILWLGNITEIGGNDLAISSQEFSNRFPFYKEEVTITAKIRNNGVETLSPLIALEVNDRIEQRQTWAIQGGGASLDVTFDWNATQVGKHTIRVIVDPYNHIPETNLKNNYPEYLGINTTVEVRYTTLIVADDGEESSARIRDIYDDFGYAYDYEVVASGDDGPSADEMASYNTICWVTGSRDSALTETDIDNIWELLNRTELNNFIFIGDYILRDLQGNHDDFIEEVLKIDPEGIVEALPTDELVGTLDDPVSHGMRYFTEFTTGTTHYYDHLGGVPILRDENQDRTIAHRYEGSRYRLVFTSFDISHFSSPVASEEQHWYDRYDLNTSIRSMQGEFLYMINRWFGNVDNRVELRMSAEDVVISDDHPMLGRTYQITVRVQNVGDTASSALVRFRDGTSHLGSVSAFIPPNGFSDVEIMWQPLHAGANRPIRVVVDAIHEIPEIPNQPGERTEDDYFGFNNQAILYTPVYYFWDDMQDDARLQDNWAHEAQVALINGETPLDFMGDSFDDIDTNVAGDWDEAMTHGVVNTTDEAKSDPYSYFMLEPKGGRLVDVFLGIVIDNSHSMSKRNYPPGDGNPSWLDHAKEGAITLVNSLSNGSVVCVWRFGGQNAVQHLSPTLLEGGGRQTVIDSIDGMEDQPITSIWDAIGGAYFDIMDNITDYEHDLYPALAVLADGGDIQSADDSTNLRMLESGSTEWAPWGEMKPEEGYPIENYPSHLGKYQFPFDAYTPSDNGIWRWSGSESPRPAPQYDPNRKGLLYSDAPIFTIGLGIEHFDNIPNWDEVTTFGEPSDGDSNEYHVYMPDDPDDPERKEAGTLEYNLWRAANTSGAEYFFAPDPGDLEDIFETIAYMLQRPENLTAIEDDFVINEDDDEEWIKNFDKYAVTPALDLTNTEEAWLTFWHKYRLIQGVNGAYMEIGYEDPDDPGEYLWRYVEPSIGPYTGNLLLSEIDTDDFDNDIIWCWNGKSAGGTMQWEFVKVDLLRDEYEIPEDKLDTVRVRFYYKQFGGGVRDGGWWLDDVSVVVTRIGNSPDNIEPGMHDVWHLYETIGPDGQTTRVWRNADPNTDENYFRKGIDNRLVTAPIYLTNAKTAFLSADFKFNINTAGGRPPDGFRVEVSTDNGRSWEAINLGVRAATGVSGSGGDAGGNIGYNWTTVGELDRLNVDLSDYAGNVILIRFRVFTCSHPNYNNYADPATDGGFYVNNVIVLGETIQE